MHAYTRTHINLTAKFNFPSEHTEEIEAIEAATGHPHTSYWCVVEPYLCAAEARDPSSSTGLGGRSHIPKPPAVSMLLYIHQGCVVVRQEQECQAMEDAV